MFSTSWRTAGLAIAILLVADPPGPTIAAKTADSSGKLTLTSSDFSAGGNIPTEFTCDGADSSPALKWTEPPEGTKSLALIMDDPDAPVGTWVHWVTYNLPPATRELPQGMLAHPRLANGALNGRNDFRRLGYGGPCPPPGPAHRYFFKLYALDLKLAAGPGLSKQELEKAMQGHILARAELMGRYMRAH